MKLEILNDELNRFLEEADSLQTPLKNTEQSEKEESLEKLLEEIIGSVRPNTTIPPTPDDKIPFFLFNKEKFKEFSRFRLFPIILSIALLGGIFLGTIFGYFWGKSQKEIEGRTALEAIETKLDRLIQDSDAARPTPPRETHEIIEPLNLPNRLEALL